MSDIAAIASSPLWIQKERGAHRSPLRIVCTSRWRTASRHVVHIGSCMYRAIANERAKSWALALAMSMYMQFSIRRVAACIGFAPFQFRSVLVANTSTRTIECQARRKISPPCASSTAFERVFTADLALSPVLPSFPDDGSR